MAARSLTGTGRHAMVDRRLAGAVESLELARAALERNRGNITEQDWAAHVARQERRIAELVADRRAA